jgi:hypothetical protein
VALAGFFPEPKNVIDCFLFKKQIRTLLIFGFSSYGQEFPPYFAMQTFFGSAF